MVAPARKSDELSCSHRYGLSRGFNLSFETTAAIGFILIYCMVCAFEVDGLVGGWADDWAQYIMHARALAQGQAYSDIGYVWSIYAPLIGPPAYPPGTAFVLAPAFVAFGYSIEIAKFSMVLCFGLFLLAFYAFLTTVGSRTIALATLAFVALNPVFWWSTQSVASDNPYLMFCYFALLVAMLRECAVGLPAILGYSVLLGILISLAYLTRDVGIILLFSVITVDLVRWRQLAARILPIVAIFVLSAIWQSQLLASTTAYDQIVLSMLGTDISGNIFRLFNDFRFYAYLGGHIDVVTGGVLLVFSAVGCWQTLKPSVSELRRPKQAAFTRLLSAARALPLHFIFVTANILFLALLPFDSGGRYLRPFAPILMWYAVCAASALIRMSSRPRVTGACLALAAGVLTAGTYIINASPRPVLGVQTPSGQDAQALFAAVERLVPKDQVVAFAKPRAMALLSGRKSMGWPSTGDRRWDEILALQGIGNFAITNRFNLFGEDESKLQDLENRTKPTVLFQNKEFTLYRIEKPNGG